MTKDDIIRMARKVGISKYGLGWTCWEGQLERFAALVAAHEREECIAIVLDNSDGEGICCTDDVLEAIRVRGKA